MKEGAFLVRLVCSLLGTACLAALGVVAVAAPAGAQAQMGAITGSVDDAATGAVLAGICVYAYPVSAYGPRTNPSAPNPTPYEATTAVDGSYEMGVPDSGYDYVVRFDPSCGGTKTSPYASQYAALGQLDFQSAKHRSDRLCSGHRCRRPPGARVLHLGHREGPGRGDRRSRRLRERQRHRRLRRQKRRDRT